MPSASLVTTRPLAPAESAERRTGAACTIVTRRAAPTPKRLNNAGIALYRTERPSVVNRSLLCSKLGFRDVGSGQALWPDLGHGAQKLEIAREQRSCCRQGS